MHLALPQGHQPVTVGTHKQVDHYSYAMNSLLGAGAFSKVFLGNDLLRSKEESKVAIKVLDLKMMNASALNNLLTREIQIMKNLQHRNIVQLYDVVMTSNRCYVIMEYCNEGDLEGLLQKRKYFPEQEVLDIVGDIVCGFNELLKYKILHRDLKPANIFIHDGIFKIGDFGFAKEAANSSQALLKNSLVGTPLYMSPQCLQNKGYSSKNDVWALGIMFYELLYGVTPWPCSNHIELLNSMFTIPLRYPDYIPVSQITKQFIQACLQLNEAERITWDDIFKHPLFYEKVEQSKLPEKLNISNLSNKEEHEILSDREVNQPPTLYNVLLENNKDRSPICFFRKTNEKQKSGLSFKKFQSNYQDGVSEIRQNEVAQFKVNDSDNNSTKIEEEIQHKNIQDYQKTLKEQYLQEQFKINDSSIQCVLHFIDIFNFTLNMHQRIPQGFDANLSVHTKEKLLFLLQKLSMMYIAMLEQAQKTSENVMQLLEWDSYLQTNAFEKWQARIHEKFESNSFFFDKNFEHLQTVASFMSFVENNQEFQAVFNNQYLNYQEINNYSKIVISFLVQLIRELNHEIRKYFLENQNKTSQALTQDEKQLILFLASLIDCQQILERTVSLNQDFKKFVKENNIQKVVEKHHTKFINTITLDYFFFLRKNIYDLKI